jgi:hypothetical protein
MRYWPLLALSLAFLSALALLRADSRFLAVERLAPRAALAASANGVPVVDLLSLAESSTRVLDADTFFPDLARTYRQHLDRFGAELFAVIALHERERDGGDAFVGALHTASDGDPARAEVTLARDPTYSVAWRRFVDVRARFAARRSES